MHNNTAIFAVSLDKSDGLLWLEDVLSWNESFVHKTQTLTERRKLMKSFLDHHWMPDARCVGGLQIRIANYQSLDSLKEHQDETTWWAIDLCPEHPDRRRFRVKAAGGKFSSLVAEAKPVSGLPDVYELWSAEDKWIGRAAIQELSLSRQIRETVAKEKAFVEVDWSPSFEKFRVLKIVSSATPRSPYSRFDSAKVGQKQESLNTQIE
jgi:hypothetical protein